MRYIEHRKLMIDNRTIPYELERKTVKNINLRVRPDGSVYVSANPTISLNHIEDFMTEKQQFILSNIDDIARLQQEHPPCRLEQGETLYLAGKPYTLHIEEYHFLKAGHDDTAIYMQLPTASWENKLNAYDTLLCQEASLLFTNSIQRIWPLIQPYGVPLPEFHSRFMKSRWGSCIPLKKRISLSTYLAIMPERCIDQVVLHELCHLIHPNHSKHFYALMTKLMPDWKERKETMKKYMPYCI